MRELKLLDLFSGIGGFTLAAERADIKTVAFCEIDKFPQSVLKYRFPEIPIIEDVRNLNKETFKDATGLDYADIICGGSPCQSMSVAGNREGFKGVSGIFYEYARIVRDLMPKFVVWDNVPGALTAVVPRQPHRGQEIAAMYRSRHFAAALHSAEEPITLETDIYVADTIGEKGLWNALAKASFIGGSLVAHGGQNIMEAARDKNAVIVGPNMQNFAEMMTRARFFDAVYQVSSAEDVIEETITLLRDPALLAERQQKAYAWTVKEAAVLDGIAAALAKELRR